MCETPSIVTLDELACRLKLSKRWLHREARDGRIPSLVAGKRRLFCVSAVLETLANRAGNDDGRNA